jgi:hypothetical protein
MRARATIGLQNLAYNIRRLGGACIKPESARSVSNGPSGRKNEAAKAINYTHSARSIRIAAQLCVENVIVRGALHSLSPDSGASFFDSCSQRANVEYCCWRATVSEYSRV